MERKVRFEELLPDELIEERRRSPVVFLPVGSMEWHGPHMAMGMDTLNALEVSLRLARREGGVVYPPLFIGTEQPRDEQTLRRVGFSGDEHIVGMDFPGNPLGSLYWPEALFRGVVRQQVELLKEMGYRLVLILNGHGADNQLAALDDIARACSDARARVIAVMTLFDDCGVGIGHAGLAETAIMQAVCPQGVALEKLPPKPERLRNVDYAIVDNETFAEGPNEDYTVRHDPRDATPELGERLLEHAVERCADILRRAKAELAAE